MEFETHYIMEGALGSIPKGKLFPEEHAVLALQDFMPYWDDDEIWGSELFDDLDFSKDPNQNIVKVSLGLSTIVDDAADESLWVRLNYSVVDEDGERLYSATFENDPVGFNLEVLANDLGYKDKFKMPIMVPSRAILCVYDDDNPFKRGEPKPFTERLN